MSYADARPALQAHGAGVGVLGDPVEPQSDVLNDRDEWDPTHRTSRRLITVAKTLISIASYGLIFGILILVWPQKLHGPFGLVIVSGTSMLPTLHTGDVVVLRAKPTYDVGDIVVYRVNVEGGVFRIVHRVVARESEGLLITQGDNRPNIDPFRPKTSDVDGRVVTFIPKVGQVMTVMADWRVSGGLAAVVVFLALLFPSKGDEQDEDVDDGLDSDDGEDAELAPGVAAVGGVGLLDSRAARRRSRRGRHRYGSI